MTIFINRMMRIFDQIVKSAKIDNEWIKNYLDDIWYHEVYVNSEEYVERCMELRCRDNQEVFSRNR